MDRVALCVICAEPGARAPRIYIRQHREIAQERVHELSLCKTHGAALRAGEIAPPKIIYDWAYRERARLIDSARLVLRPELRCLACNSLLPTVDQDGDLGRIDGERLGLVCSHCRTQNVVGFALGCMVAVKQVATPSAATA